MSTYIPRCMILFAWNVWKRQIYGERWQISGCVGVQDGSGIWPEGIRLENELLCVEEEANEYGKFLKFESVTFAPIDLDGIEPSYMTEKERETLNAYHKDVYDVISPYLDEEEQAWLAHYTRAI